MTSSTTGRFTFADWKENPVGGSETLPRLAHASVTNTFSGGIEADGTICEYSIVYVTEKTGTFTGMQVLSGRLDGRRGTFVVEERGSFEADGTVHCAFEVVPGSGTEELAGLRGTGGYTARHGEPSYPYTFGYELD
ncbi:DUF3224 domain-containing protein [Streptomyces sp. GC420]|uniref:DUF3224 domain-containing protein n=1 Tax=Streptomyces sp. GC420 TaxID=2697568 RepID=UPI001414D962|nr:DUF3224 domain-containing protein [Streptomyces sp. GC420]NBM16585.1 DUF3224 domain-containing protein [Streptomyces sp. GC420]